ncbi:MAG TPA: DinB family protein [Gemmatimonadaceae bacterium]|nr:DinB family protein [Gemmatimonadaceae bacterium]
MPITACFSDLEGELASTRRMLAPYPDGKGEWRPHPKSSSLSRLANHVAGIPDLGTAILTSEGLDFATRTPQPPAETAAGLLARFDDAARKMMAAFASTSDEVFNGEWTLRHGEHVVLKGRRRDLFRQLMLSHLIHHRAQLGDCYRLLDLPVPGMYGPTADG